MYDFVGKVLLKSIIVCCYAVLFFVYTIRLFIVFEEIIYYVCKFLCKGYFERKDSRK